MSEIPSEGFRKLCTDPEELIRRLSSPAARPEDEATLIDLIQRGVLIAVSVFGGMDEDWGYGLCDTFTARNQVGSDCNRAARFLLRPDEGRMTQAVLEALSIEDDPEPATQANGLPHGCVADPMGASAYCNNPTCVGHPRSDPS